MAATGGAARPPGLTVPLLVAALACGGCDREAAAEASGPPPEVRAAPQRARFAKVDFLKPRMDAPAGIDPYLAPLLCLEAPHGAPLGSARVNGRGELDVDATQPALYYARGSVLVEGGERSQLSFVWFRDTRPPVAQGVRLTLDAEGFPLIAEVLTDRSGRRVMYLASELEDAALDASGVRLASDELEVALAGHFKDAPAPSGPYVYLACDSTDVAAIHCRCAALLADEIRETIEYQLLPLAALDGVWPRDGQPGFAAPGAAVRALRLPSSF